MEELIKLTRELTNAFGPSGFEDDVLKIIKNYVGADNCDIDSINNLYIGLKNIDENKPTILLDCHTDEVGFMVESINQTGTINFLPLGGWFDGTLPSSPVIIKNFNGDLIKGIISSKPVHFMSPEERNKVLKISELVIDIGTSSYEETVERGIEVGNPIVPDSEFLIDNKNKVVRAKALDNRLGCVTSIYVYNSLKDKLKELPFNLVVSCSAQEEVGCRGAEVSSKKINPDFVFVYEASPADDSFKSANLAKGKLGHGLQFRVIDGTMISNPRMLSYFKKLATEKNISYQIIARSGGGTNASRYHLSAKATPTLVMGAPSRYIHTHYSYASLYDLKSMIDLSLVFLENFNKIVLEQF